jgi:hypothetical protein
VPAFSVQYHPEAGPGPHDARYLFDIFKDLMLSPEKQSFSGELIGVPADRQSRPGLHAERPSDGA